jgi:hypothetical protein
MKPSSGAGRWSVFDSSRNTYHVVNAALWPNDSSAEVTGYGDVDFLSNGFKWRSTNGYTNDSGVTYIYAAFAETPAKFSLAR